jgi:TetR/AcrR family transcriptional regulator
MDAMARMSAEQRKQVIMEAALRVFAQKGYSGARTKAIAQKAGVSETLVFKHFGSKLNLYEQSLHHLFGSHPVLEDVAAAMEAEDDFQVLYQLALHIMRHGREDDRIVRLNLFGGLEGMDLAKYGQDPVKLIEDYLAMRISKGALKKTNARLAAQFFIYSVFLYVADMQLKISGLSFRGDDAEAARVLTDIFLHGLQG